jgi:hypothetical protein
METKQFLESTLAGTGHYCIFASRPVDDKRVQKFYPSLDAVIEASRTFDADGYDVYFALATFNDTVSRKVTNVEALKAFFLDLDCGPSKDFANQVEAIAALRTFCKANKLPRPAMVNSGYGVHVYWFLTEAVDLDTWLPVAEKLKALCAAQGFRADPSVTADAARILRVPDTTNYKYGVEKQVAVLASDGVNAVDFSVFSALLGSDLKPVSRRYIPSDSNAVMDALMGNRESKFRDIMIKTREGNGCAQLAEIIRLGGNVPEPLWRAGLSIAHFCVDGQKAAVLMSQDHPEYNIDDTMEKMQRTKGPYLCSRFNDENPSLCQGCPNLGKIKSPITLGSYIREATDEDNIVTEPVSEDSVEEPEVHVIPKFPAPYFRGATGGVYLRVVDTDGGIDERCIYHNDLYVTRRIVDRELGHSIVMKLHLPKDGAHDFTVPLAAVTSKEELRKQMSMVGVAVPRMDDLMTYILAWVNELQAQKQADEAHRQFGWTGDECKSFVLGDKEIYADKIELNPPSATTAGLMFAFEPKGTLDGWKDMISFYERPGFELHQYVVGTSFGSPLMQFTAVHCAALHVYSKESGVGKTTALSAALSVWGRPEELMLNERDTYNTKMHRGEVMHSMPLMMDELTNANPKDLSNLVYQITGGKQRGRMSGSANTERLRGEAWKLLAVTTGNTSIVEQIGTIKNGPKAEAQRILEARAYRMKFSSKEETDVFSNRIFENYGHAGTPYIQYIISNQEAVRKMVVTVQKRIDEAAKLTEENRFWSAGAACTMTGLIIAKKIGLINFDIEAIFKWLVATLAENKATVSDMGTSAQEILNNYVHEKWQNILWIKSTQDLRGTPNNNGLDELVVPESQPRGQLVARYETDIKRLYLLPKPLKLWCGDQQINFGSFMDELTKGMQAERGKMRLGKGTHMNLPPANVIIVDVPLGGAVDEAGSAED